MSRLVLNLILALATISQSSFAADDCLNFTDLIKKVRTEVAAGAKVKSSFVELNWSDGEPDAKWLREFGSNVSSIDTDWLTDAKAAIPQQIGCERIKNMGDTEMIIARSTREELELHLDGEIFAKQIIQSLARSLGRIGEKKPKAPEKPPARAVVPKPGETQTEAIARTLSEAMGEQIGDALLEALGEAMNDPKVQQDLIEQIEQQSGGNLEKFKKEIEERIRFVIRHEEAGKLSIRIKNSYGDGAAARGFETTHIIRWGQGELPKDTVSPRVEAFLRVLAEAKKADAEQVLP